MKSSYKAYIRAWPSPHKGVGHWLAQRVSSLGLIILGSWFLISIRYYPLQTVTQVKEWLSVPYNGILMLLFLGTSFYHAYLGLHVIIEDYVHGNVARTSLLGVVKFLCLGGLAIGIFSVVKLALLP